MPPVKIGREEMEIVKEAALRLERRSNTRFVIDTRVEVTDDESKQQPSEQASEGEAKPPVIFD